MNIKLLFVKANFRTFLKKKNKRGQQKLFVVYRLSTYFYFSSYMKNTLKLQKDIHNLIGNTQLQTFITNLLITYKGNY